MFKFIGRAVGRVKTDISTAVSVYQGLGLTASFFSFFQGRCTFFAILFSVCGLIGFFKHYDLTSYALFVGAIQAMIVAHSAKEDWISLRRPDKGNHNGSV